MTASQRSTASRERRGHERLVVVRRAEIDRVGAGTGELREEHRPIGVADLPRRERPRLDELVARREHAHARARIGAHPAGVDRRQHPDACGGQHLPGLEHHVAGFEVATGAAHVPTGLDLQGHGDAVVAVARGALHHHDAVGTIGHRGAGHDPDRLSRSDRDGGRVPGGELPHHLEPHRVLLAGTAGVGGLHRVAVHRGVGERRNRLGRGHPLGEDEPEGVGQARLDRLEAGHRREDRGLDLGQRLHDRRSRTRARR